MASNITSVSKREKVISLWSSGYRNKEICSRLHLSHQTVSNILSKFLQNGTAAPGKPGWKEHTVATPNVVEFVEYWKVFKPSTRTFEIQQGLLANAICTPANLPARSTISDIVRQDLNSHGKKLSVPEKSWKSSENFELYYVYVGSWSLYGSFFWRNLGRENNPKSELRTCQERPSSSWNLTVRLEL